MRGQKNTSKISSTATITMASDHDFTHHNYGYYKGDIRKPLSYVTGPEVSGAPVRFTVLETMLPRSR